MESLKPSLVEPGVKYFIGGALKQCREFKDKHINILFNISAFIFIITLIVVTLVCRYKGKLTPAEVEIKNIKKREYIVSKLQQFSAIKKQYSEKLISDLPNWDDHPELHILRNPPPR
jgi:hypothetical protein